MTRIEAEALAKRFQAEPTSPTSPTADAAASANPGYCFKQAGWRTCGRNKDGRLTILERLP
jgi:hypothetical protein